MGSSLPFYLPTVHLFLCGNFVSWYLTGIFVCSSFFDSHRFSDILFYIICSQMQVFPFSLLFLGIWWLLASLLLPPGLLRGGVENSPLALPSTGATRVSPLSSKLLWLWTQSSPILLFLAQMGKKFSQLPLQCLFQLRPINEMDLKPSVLSGKLHLLVVYFIFNVPLHSVG